MNPRRGARHTSGWDRVAGWPGTLAAHHTKTRWVAGAIIIPFDGQGLTPLTGTAITGTLTLNEEEDTHSRLNCAYAATVQAAVLFSSE